MRDFNKTTMAFTVVWVMWGIISVSYTGSTRGVFLPSLMAWLAFCGTHWAVFLLVKNLTTWVVALVIAIQLIFAIILWLLMPGPVLLFITPYLINMVVFTLPGLKADLISGIILLLIASGISFIGDKPPIRIISVLVVLTGYILVSRVTVELNEANGKALSKAHQEADRERIARDIHDLLGQSLTVVALKAQIIERLSADPHNKQQAAEITAISRQAIGELRYTVAQLRCHTMNEELEAATQALEAAGIKVMVHRNGEMRHREFSWVLRKAVTNIIRYSQATECTITMSNGGLQISDNGIEGETAHHDAEFAEVAQRITQAGGSFRLEHMNGTTITAELR